MKRYKCEFYEVDAPDTHCLFCKKYTDVFWDITNGPYMFFCAEGHGNWKTCNSFEEEKLNDAG